MNGDSSPSSDALPDELRGIVRRAYTATLRTVKRLLGERFQLVRLARRAYRKTLDEEEAMSAVKDDLLTLVRLMRAWATGRYRHISRQALLSIVGAVLYFVSPVDAIPDFIPVAGFADDLAVVAAVVRSVRDDLERFRQWEAWQRGDAPKPPALLEETSEPRASLGQQ